MYANHPRMARRWSQHTATPVLPDRVSDSLELAACYGDTARAQLEASLIEASRPSSLAMAVIPGDAPGRRVCAFLRDLSRGRTRLLVAAQGSELEPGVFERMLRASMPDCESRIFAMEVGPSLAEAISTAEMNDEYESGQALEVFCSPPLAVAFQSELSHGGGIVDPTVISINPQRIPMDDHGAIVAAVEAGDQRRMRDLLDPHVFSSGLSVAEFRRGLVREFLSDISPSRELAIRTLRDILAAEVGGGIDDLQYLGTGRNGSAYRHPDGFIVKVTTDPMEARSAGQLVGASPNHLGRIFSVRPVADGVWMLIQEDLEPLPDDLSQEFDEAIDGLSERGALDLLNQGRLAEAMGSLMDNPRSTASHDAGRIGTVLRRFGVVGMCRELRELGLTADFHSGNIMLRGGSPVLVDLGTPGDDPGRIDEFGTGSPGSGANGPPQMRGSNSSSWASGQLALKRPENHVPEDENASERDSALDWGPGRVSGASF